MISDITAVPEVGKVYLGKVVRLAEFGAFVELFPGTGRPTSHLGNRRAPRKEVKDELREGDQVMVKVLAIEGNRIKLSRKALIKEQKAKLGQQAPAEAAGEEAAPRELAAPAPAPKPRNEFDERQPRSNQSTILIEGGDDFDEEGGEEIDEATEPNFNRAEGAPVAAGQPSAGGRPQPNNNRRRRPASSGRPRRR